MAVPLASAFVRIEPDVDRAAFKRAGEEAGAEAGSAAGKSYGDGFKRDSAGRLRQANGQFATDEQKRMLGVGDESGKKFGEGFKRSVKKSVGDDKSGGSSVFGRVAAVAASKFALIGLAAVAATPGVIHLTAALLPAAGAMAALPVSIAAFVVAGATFKIATAGVGDAIKAGLTGTAKQAKKALDALPPSAKQFATSIVALNPQIKSLKTAVSENFFAPLQGQITRTARVYFPLLTKSMADLALPLGGLGQQFLQTARQSSSLGAIRAVFGNTSKAAVTLRQAIQPLVGGFAALISATAGRLPGIATGFVKAATAVGQFVAKASQSGAVNNLISNAIKTLKDLGGIAVNVGSILVSVFRAAAAGSGSLLGNFRALTGQIAAFLSSAQGLAGVSSVFAVLSQLGAGLHRSLGAVLPAIAQSLQTLGPAIGALAGPASQLIVALAPLLPAVAGIAATLITKLTPAISSFANFLAQHNQVVKAAAIALTGFLAVQKVSAAFIAVNAAGGLVAYIRQTQIVTSATKVWTSVQLAFNAVMELNPIILVTTLIAALVVGIIYAYKHSQTFRDIVQGAFNGIKAAAAAVAAFFTGTVFPAFVSAFNGIKSAALFLWRNVFEPVWHGIMAVVGVVVSAVRAYLSLLVAEFNIVKTVALFLWHNVFGPVFAAIRKIVEIWWLAVEIIFKAFSNILTVAVGGALKLLRSVWNTVFTFLSAVVRAWWANVQTIFGLFRTYILGPIVSALGTVRNFFAAVFRAIGAYISAWWRGTVAPVFAAVRVAWNTLATAFSVIYNTRIKPIFSAFIGFIKGTVVGGFNAAVGAIRAAWDKVREAARVPVAFVVTHVINPFINGLNAVAGAVGVKNRVTPIKGFSTGGRIPGYAEGGRISGAPSSTDNRLAPATIPGVGAVKLAGGEFVVNAQDTAKALPLLKWINDGMKAGGPAEAAKRIGRPMSDLPGDGSEGWAFAGGGLVGWAKDVWGAISDPIGALKKPADALLNAIPGGGMIRDFLKGAASKVIGSAVDWLKGFGGFTQGTFAYHGPKSGRIAASAAYVRAQEGKPYVWNSAGPGGFDCSGIVSAAYNILKGGSPNRHTFSTEGLPGGFFKMGTGNGPLVAGWSHPGQSPASASTGHMAGNIAGLAFESRGSKGVVVGSNARSVSQFANLGSTGLADGGLFGKPVRLFDNGGMWPSGTLGANLSGRTEYVDPNRGAGGAPRTYNLTINVAAGAHPAEVGRQTVLAIQAYERSNGTKWRR